ncbi:thioredoxin [Massilia antarctica]|uniref:Thioredoxin n=1 Tax=Massilia antarctica TaxID=2765360 RepID=A0AA48WEE0_9BURK|nr:thioredoxin [Massilia antarctica]QPI49884.1 thioredoxin [Massilia antarctica]
MSMLDPWDHASALAQRLQAPESRLMIVVGAEAWCARCREVRPDVDALAARAPDDETWLWLDMEDHGQFLGDYQPGNLPMMFVYRGQRLVSATFLDNGATLERAATGAPMHPDDIPADPGIRARLLQQDWALE